MKKAIEMPGDGQTMVELGLILALVSIVAIALLAGMGGKIQETFQGVNDAFTPAP